MSQLTKSPTTGATTLPTKVETGSSNLLARPSHVGFWALALGFAAFLVWATLAPLDEGVASPGVVSVDTKHKAIQHLTGGIVKEVLVQEGQQVNQGDVLLRLDDVTARANYESIRQRYLGMRATQGRLQAEQAGAGAIVWHPDLVQASTDPLIRQQMTTQQQLATARRGALAADLQGLEESIRGQEELIRSYADIGTNRRRQLTLLQEELTSTNGLIEQGYAPRNRRLELERAIAESSASLAELAGNTLRARHAIAELRQRAIGRQQDYRKEIETQLGEVTRDVQSDAERLKAVRDDLTRTEVLAPAAGQVVGLAYQTVGGVIPPGQKIADVIPKGAFLLLESQVQPGMIDRVKTGQAVDVRFSAFANSPQLVVQGKVQSVSADALSNPQGTQSFYLARVIITEEGMKKLGQRQLQAGMPVEVVFKGGERSLMTYLLHPLLKRIAASLKEE